MHDHAGWYICWGCLAYVPSIYTGSTLCLVNNPIQLGTPLALTILLAGIGFVYMNYDADNQRAQFRKDKGKKIWGKIPEKVQAMYVTEEGKRKIIIIMFWLLGYI